MCGDLKPQNETALVPGLLCLSWVEVRFPNKGRGLALLGLIFFAVSIVAAAELLHALDQKESARPIGAYLIKDGDRYLLAWRTRFDESYRLQHYASLASAQRQTEKLGLVLTRPGRPVLMERFSKRQSRRGTVVQWRSSFSPDAQRLTFKSEKDAQFFVEALDRGSYSPSLFGHALFYGHVDSR